LGQRSGKQTTRRESLYSRASAARDREQSLDQRPEQALSIAADPLRDAAILNLPRKPLPFKPAVPYLGVLIDGGRHYFPIEWLKNLVDRLADMNYNLIHLRLTDDQAFNVLFDSHPDLAFPSSVDNPEKKVYSVPELRDLTAYAKKKGIRIMPEVNVPGHAGSWAGVPGLIVHCPDFICEMGYGVPLNVTHPSLRPILTDIIKELVDIFDDPPFIHLGGDEVNMAVPCFEEVGAKVFDYPAFEQVLKKIIADVGYPEDRIVRWEMTGQANLTRAGTIEHFWESHPGDRHEPAGPFFMSHGMYFDTNEDENSDTVVTKSNKGFSLDNGRLPVAIIAGCFELSVQFWFDRNILGRLLSVAMGASNLSFSEDESALSNFLWFTEETKDEDILAQRVIAKHKQFCNDLGFGQTVCDKEGTPMISTDAYHKHWKADWVTMKDDICERVSEPVPYRAFKDFPNLYMVSLLRATGHYWKVFPNIFGESKKINRVRPSGLLPEDLLRKHVVPHTYVPVHECIESIVNPSSLIICSFFSVFSGIILDMVNSIVEPKRISAIIKDDVAQLGFTMVQMRLVTNNGFSIKMNNTSFENTFVTDSGSTPYGLKEDLAPLVATAARLGIEVMPEISVSSDGGGWFNTGYMGSCPEHFCQASTTPNNVNDPLLLPVLFYVISQMRKVFSSKFFHLGSDERIGSEPCFKELGVKPDFDKFEMRLTHLLKMNGISPDHIVRSENSREKTHVGRKMYEGRTGSITQLRAGSNELEEPDDIVFFTVDIEDGDAWTVYQRTKELVAQEPLGIMAEVRALLKSHWENVDLPKRLLAFSMALSELPTAKDSAAFAEAFQAICETLSLDTDCTPPGKLKRHTSYVTDGDKFREKVCDARTNLLQKHIAKVVPPFYTSTGIARANSGNSTVAAKPVADKKKH
jgi:hypothetical protein